MYISIQIERHKHWENNLINVFLCNYFKEAKESFLPFLCLPLSPFLSLTYFPVPSLFSFSGITLSVLSLLSHTFFFIPPSLPSLSIVSPPSQLLPASLSSMSLRCCSTSLQSFGGLAGSGVSEDGPDEAIRAGGVIDGLPPIASSMALYHFQGAAVGSPCSVLTPVCGHFRSYINTQTYIKT